MQKHTEILYQRIIAVIDTKSILVMRMNVASSVRPHRKEISKRIDNTTGRLIYQMDTIQMKKIAADVSFIGACRSE